MINKMCNVRVYLLVFLFVYCIVPGSPRTLSCFVNPGLNKSQEDPTTNVVHIISEGNDDTIHYIWSTYKFPSLIVSRTTKNTTLYLDTQKLISFEKDFMKFSSDPLVSVGLTFTELWELHYLKDAQSVSNITSVEGLDLESFNWIDVNNSFSCSENFASANLTSESDEVLFSKNGTFEIQFSVSASQELSVGHPHLVFTGNSTLLRVIMNQLYSNYSRSRYALGVSIFSVSSDKCESDNWETVVKKSINDEFSPGVFSDVELLAPCSDEKSNKGSFISWRPVAYTGIVPIVANSSDATMMKNPEPIPRNIPHSIAELYFADKSNASGFNITFGTEGDGFYQKTEYTEWSLMAGTGTMVVIPLSLSVIIFASVGLGLVLFFIISGLIFVLYNRFKDKDDDLLLN